MQISELIQKLQATQEAHGDIKVFTNGEHGYLQTVPLLEDYVDVGVAGGESGLLGEEDQQYFQLGDDEIIVHIGGY